MPSAMLRIRHDNVTLLLSMLKVRRLARFGIPAKFLLKDDRPNTKEAYYDGRDDVHTAFHPGPRQQISPWTTGRPFPFSDSASHFFRWRVAK
jgi:hypothetical protein